MYTYTIFDGDPASSGPCAWPSHENVEVEADSPEEALSEALDEARAEGEACGAYRDGTTLWVLVWDADGIRVADGTVDIEAEPPEAPVGNVDWEVADGYVVCLYGTEGDEPGDCYTRVGEDEAGWYWVDDGDETERPDEYGPYSTKEEARAKATAVADEQNEAEPGEDAADMRARLLTERAGEPDPEGEWCVYWDTTGEDGHVVERYTDEDAATAAAELANEGLHRKHPGGQLLCGYEVRHLDDEGDWVASFDEA